MNILGLPTEIFEIIVHQAILSRGVKRGVRLRLVNKTFATAVMKVLYAFRHLDDLYNVAQKSTQRVWPIFLKSYLAYRVLHEPACGNALLVCFQRIANEIFNIRDVFDQKLSTMKSYVDTLCYRSKGGFPRHLKSILENRNGVSGDEYQIHLLAAAVCTNTLPIVQQIIDKNDHILNSANDFETLSSLFGSVFDLAGRYGNNALVECLVTHNGHTLDLQARARIFEFAAKAGRAEVVRFLYDFRGVPWRFGDFSTYEGETLWAAFDTSNLEVFSFIDHLRTVHSYQKLQAWKIQRLLYDAAETGQLDWTACLVELGAHPGGEIEGGGIVRNNGPLRYACEGGHTAVVRFLLKQGADPNATIAIAASRGHEDLVRQLLKDGIIPRKDSLTKAVAGSYLGIVRLLLDSGVDPNDSIGPESPLATAIASEYAAMFELLVERGAELQSRGTAEECVRRAKNDGLESMLLLLGEQGVEVE